MPNNQHHFTSESVSESHPDKVADQISYGILDAYPSKDPKAKVACECLITTGQLVIAGEINSTIHVDALALAKYVLKSIGYDNPDVGFDYKTAGTINLLHEQSCVINQSVFDGGGSIYFETVAYRHFGKPDLPWEQIDAQIIYALNK